MSEIFESKFTFSISAEDKKLYDKHGDPASVVRLTLLYIWRSLTVSVQPMRSTQRRADFACDFQYIV